MVSKSSIFFVIYKLKLCHVYVKKDVTFQIHRFGYTHIDGIKDVLKDYNLIYNYIRIIIFIIPNGLMLILPLKFLTETCGGTYIGQSGVIHSPGFPGSNYPDSSSCEWYLEGPTGHYLTLSYVNFSVQPSPECSVDYVEIREYNASGKARL